MGLLLGVERADASIEAEKDEPGVKYPGLRIVTCIPRLPTKKPFAVAAGNPAGGCSSPLTVAAPLGNFTHFARPPGRTGECEVTGSSVSCSRSIAPGV
jgi:hypothetical protein